MNEVLARLARALNPLLGIIIAIGGACAGGVIANSPVGAILGAVFGTALGLGVSGAIAALGSIEGKLASVLANAPAAAASVRLLKPVATALPAYAGGSHAMNGHTHVAIAPAAANSAIALVSTAPTEAAVSDPKIESTETEAQLLAAGKFAEYHLAKAKRLFTANNFKDAAYQASASLAHGDLAEAKEIYKTARAQAK